MSEGTAPAGDTHDCNNTTAKTSHSDADILAHLYSSGAHSTSLQHHPILHPDYIRICHFQRILHKTGHIHLSINIKIFLIYLFLFIAKVLNYYQQSNSVSS